MTEVLLRPRKLLLLGKSLVYFFILTVLVNFCIVTVVTESILSQFFLCLISSGSREEMIIDTDMAERQVTYTVIHGSASEEGSELL